MTSVEDSTLDCPASVIYAAEAGYCFRTKGEQTAQQPPAGCSGVDMFSTISTDGTHDQVCVVGSEDEETREPRIDTGENGKSRVEGISRDGISVTNLDCVLDNVFDDHEHVLGRHLMHAPGVLESVSYRSVKYEHNLAGDDVLARSWGTHESRDNDNQETRSRSKEPTTSSVPRGTARTQNHATSVTSVNDSYSFSRYPSVHASVRTLQETSMSMCLLDQQRAPINEGQNSPDRTPPNSTSISPNHPTLIVRSASPNSGSGAPETRTSSSLLAQEEQDSHQVVYGRLVVLGYTASLVQWHSDPTKGVDTLREGGNDVLELCRRENGNGYAISAPVQYSAFKYKIQYNPKNKLVYKILRPITSISVSSPRKIITEFKKTVSETTLDKGRKMPRIRASTKTPFLRFNITKGAMKTKTTTSPPSVSEQCTPCFADPTATTRLTDDSFKYIGIKSPTHHNRVAFYECTPSPYFDVFQIGRTPSRGIHFVVPGESYVHAKTHKLAQPKQPRFQFRIVCNRHDPDDVRVFAGCFDGKGRILMGGRNVRWEEEMVEKESCQRSRSEVIRGASTYSPDALSQAGVLLWKPGHDDLGREGKGFTDGTKCGRRGRWVEVSVVNGNAYELRTKPHERGNQVEITSRKHGHNRNKDPLNRLTDGCIIYAGGVAFLWKSASGAKGEKRTDSIKTQQYQSGKEKENATTEHDMKSTVPDPTNHSYQHQQTLLPLPLEDTTGTEETNIRGAPTLTSISKSLSAQSFAPSTSSCSSSISSATSTSPFTTEDFNAMLKEFESNYICPVTLDNIPTEKADYSIRGNSLRPWDRLRAKLAWLKVQAEESKEGEGSGSGRGRGRDAHRGCEPSPDVFNKRPWVFMACGLCRTPSYFKPLTVRNAPDILQGMPTHILDPCGHVLHERGVDMWAPPNGIMFPNKRTMAATGGKSGKGGDAKERGDANHDGGMPAPTTGKGEYRPDRMVKAVDKRPVLGPVSAESGDWCWYCPFCATEIKGVKKLFLQTDE